ncbi:MAG: lactonase family protein [Actinobacteria bacterium]|nr:lactonase family protein [Actinomycetota bacterium]
MSPDGKHVYVASYESKAIAAFAREPLTGSLIQLSGTNACVAQTGTSNTCRKARGLNGPAYLRSLAISPDGRHLYVASYDGLSVATFNRNATTGALTQTSGNTSCISDTGGGGCADGRQLTRPTGVAVSPDGRFVYVTNGFDGNGIATFARNVASGTLRQLDGRNGCMNETGSDGCRQGPGQLNSFSLTMAPDGMYAYLAAGTDNAVLAFQRNQTTGALTATTDGCVSEDGRNGCKNGRALQRVHEVAATWDKQHLYSAAFTSNGVAIFHAPTRTTAATVTPEVRSL